MYYYLVLMCSIRDSPGSEEPEGKRASISLE
jgi:hypothetical protein